MRGYGFREYSFLPSCINNPLSFLNGVILIYAGYYYDQSEKRD